MEGGGIGGDDGSGNVTKRRFYFLGFNAYWFVDKVRPIYPASMAVRGRVNSVDGWGYGEWI
jgi:hypothetical protein